MIAEERRRYERAREAGRQAFRGGRRERDCPHQDGHELREAWMQGFGEAQAERRRR